MPSRRLLIRSTALLSFGLPWLVLFLRDQDVIWAQNGTSVWVIDLTHPWVVTVIGLAAFAALPWAALLLVDWFVDGPRPAAHSAGRRSLLRAVGPFLVAGVDLALILYWQDKRAKRHPDSPVRLPGKTKYNF